MAKFDFDGVDAISASFDQLTKLTDEERFSIIQPAAELLKDAYAEKLKSLFVQRTGDLLNALTLARRGKNEKISISVYLKGKHRGSGTGKRKRRDGRPNGKYSGTNAEVGYILEYGSGRIRARHWMGNTNDEQADAIQASNEAQWDRLLTEKGL